MKFHPSSPNTLLSGSTDGLINIYNITHSDEDDALIQVSNHGSSINHAGFLSNTQFFALSHDENFSIYHLQSQNDNPANELPPHVFGDLRPLFECEYVVDVIPLAGNGQMILGTGSHSKRQIDLIPFSYGATWSFDESNVVRLLGAHEEEIVRSMYIDEASQAIFTAGEDGLIKAWRTSNESNEDGLRGEGVEKPEKKKKKKRAKGEDERGRFKPY